MKRLKVFVSSTLAGICIAIGGTVFLLHADGWQENK